MEAVDRDHSGSLLRTNNAVDQPVAVSATPIPQRRFPAGRSFVDRCATAGGGASAVIPARIRFNGAGVPVYVMRIRGVLRIPSLACPACAKRGIGAGKKVPRVWPDKARPIR